MTSTRCSTHTRSRERRRRGERGSAIADFALCSIVVLPLVFGILQLALIWHIHTTLVSAASEGARYGASYNRPVDAGRQRTQAVIRQEFGDRLGERVSAGEVTGAGQPIVEVSVTARVPVLAFWGPSVTLHAEGHAVKELLP